MEHGCSVISPREWVRGSVIGVGAFGTVSLALDKANGELFSVKSIECGEGKRGELLAMENEIQILKRMDSPWIVRFLGDDFSEENGVRQRNLLMEYMAGGSVADILKKFGGHLDESVIRTYTRSILKGIQYLHSLGIVHSDIKGKNVLVGSSGVKLADFGSAKRISGEEESNNESKVQLRGTPLWMAPEVVKQIEQGPASDIWSLGCTVVEMATGRPPWSNTNHPVAAMYRIGCTDELPEFPESLSVEAHDFLEKCFRRDPRQRWTSAQLLSHPFLNECTHKGSVSPTSTMDFHNAEQKWDSGSSASSISRTIPILSLHMELPTLGQEAGHSESEEKRPVEQSQRASPRQRMAELAEKIPIESVGERPNWCLSPPSSPLGNWIVVRSPKGNSPMLDSPFSDFINGSFADKAPTAQSPKVERHAKSKGSELDENSSLGSTTDDAQIDKEGSCTEKFALGIPPVNQGLPCNSMTKTVSFHYLPGPKSTPYGHSSNMRKHGWHLSLIRLKNRQKVGCDIAASCLLCFIPHSGRVTHLQPTLQPWFCPKSTRSEYSHVEESYLSQSSCVLLVVGMNWYKHAVYFCISLAAEGNDYRHPVFLSNNQRGTGCFCYCSLPTANLCHDRTKSHQYNNNRIDISASFFASGINLISFAWLHV
eukprot:Gb_40830 [translate_table: standard]